MKAPRRSWARSRGYILFVAMLLLSTKHGWAADLFGPTGYPAGSGVTSTGVGDFDSDGALDLVAVSAGSNRVRILWGDGVGGFSRSVDIPLGGAPSCVTVSDLDADGSLDLLVGNSDSGSVNVFYGDGVGGFPRFLDISVGGIPHSIAVGDFDGGARDLAVGYTSFDEYNEIVGIFLNALGGFRPGAWAYVDGSAGAVIVADFDADGRLDIAVPNFYSVRVLLGDGFGGLYGPHDYPVGPNPYPSSLSASDMNADGALDLVVTNPSMGAVTVLMGNGVGGFSATADIAVGAGPNSVAIGDINSDGALDLAVSNANGNSVSVLLGDGLGGLSQAAEFQVGQAPGSVRVGDFNADGALDLVIANLGRGDDPSTVKVLLGDDLGAFPTRPADVRVGRGAFAMAAGDINADGALDLVVANQWSDSVSLLFGDDRGGFSPAVDVHVGSGPDSIAVGYFDADDALDLAVANGGGDTISVLLGNGSGGFRLPHDFSVGHVPTSVVAKDFDGDGSIDLALLNAGDYPASGRVSILWGDNSGDFSAPVDFPVGIDADALAVGDFNTDGVPDLVVVNAGIYPGAGTVSLLLGNRSRGFAPRTDFPVGVSPVSVAVGDFNADRALDLAVSNFDSSFLTILFGDGTGDLPRSVDVHVGLERRSVVAADLNADGALDLAVANSSNSSVNVLLGLVGEGLGSFSPPMDFQVGNSPYSMAVGQFNADGVLDLAVLNAGVFPDANSTVSLLLNQLESRADTNGSNRIDGFDVARVNRLAGALASACDGNPACSYRRDADVDLNGVIDGDDLCLVASQFGKLRKDASPLHATLDVAPPVTPDVVSFHQAASEGDLLTLNILVDTDNAAAAADFAVTFEPAPGDLGRGQVLEYSGFVPGTFLAGGVGQAYSLDTSTPGEVKITVSRLPYGQDQVMSGLQPLLSLFLRARRDGEAVLEFAGRDDQTPPAILTASGRQVSVIFQGGARIAVASANSDARGQRIGAAPLPLDFGLVAIGSSTQRMLRISNFGFSELTVTGVVSELPEVTTLFSSAFTVPPFGFVELPVIFSPALDGLFSGDLVIASDDPTRPEFRVPMAGRTVYSLSVAP